MEDQTRSSFYDSIDNEEESGQLTEIIILKVNFYYFFGHTNEISLLTYSIQGQTNLRIPMDK